jgi:hypothetical protein
MTMMIFTKTSVDLRIRKSSCTDSLRSDRPKCDTGMGLGLGRAGTYETFRTHVHSKGAGSFMLSGRGSDEEEGYEGRDGTRQLL